MQAEGDVFTMELNMLAPGRLTFYRNGHLEYSVEGLDCKAEYRVTACLYHSGNKLTLMQTR